MISPTYNPEKKVWSGSKYETIYDANIGLGHLILTVLKKTPEMVTQISADTDIEITCHEMRMRTIKMASYLHEKGYKQGDVVGFIAKNSENLAPVVFACFALGLPVHVLSSMMNEHDIISMYSKTKPKIIFCDVDFVNTLQTAVNKMFLSPVINTLINKLDGYNFVDDVLSSWDASNFIFPELKDISSSTAIILCSSGTTGTSKGICKSHKQVIKQLIPTWNVNMKTREVYFNFSTLFWLSGFAFLVTATLYGGKRVITTKEFSADLMIAICDHYKVTTFMCLPVILVKLLQCKNFKPLNSLEVCLVGGSVVSKNLCKAIKPYLPNDCFPVYGTSEGDFLSSSFGVQRYGSNGQLLPNVQMKILDEVGKRLGPNEKGEICYKTPVLFSGYFDGPAETNATITNGWVHSGDIGYFDEDGFLFVVDRKTEILIFDGVLIWPSELEIIMKEVEGVIDACVVGVYEENKGDDLIFGFVMKNASNDKLTEKEISDYVNERIDDDAKKLRGGVHFIDAFPLTPSTKVKRVAMRKIAQEYYNRKINV